MRYLLDTNIISELRKKNPNEGVIKWITETHPSQLYVSCISIGELRAGALKKLKQDKVAGEGLLKWVLNLTREYAEQILTIDLETCEEWADLLVIDSTNAIDGIIAAQAKEENMTLVTRNVKHFEMFGIRLLNPFEN
jgi:predicted nucleic acid-binding protein